MISDGVGRIYRRCRATVQDLLKRLRIGHPRGTNIILAETIYDALTQLSYELQIVLVRVGKQRNANRAIGQSLVDEDGQVRPEMQES